LLSLQIQSKDEDSSAKACRQALRHFGGLIELILDDLSGNPKNWSKHDRNRISEELWKKSYAEEFQQNLRSHITKHFPQLVIPQMIDRFNILGGNAIAEWSTQTTTAILNSSEEDYQRECENIAQIRSSLEQFLEISDSKLREPFEKINLRSNQIVDKESDYTYKRVDDLIAMISDLKENEPYKDLGMKLAPLYTWSKELRLGLHQVLEAVAKSLESGKVDLDGTNLKKANHRNVNLLRNNLDRLVALGYTNSVAQEGVTKEAKTDDEKNNLKRLNEELNELGIHLSLVMEDVLQKISNQELNRMHEALVILFNRHLSYLEEGVHKIAPNMAIKFPESQLIKVETQPEINFKFKAGFLITQGTWQERKETVITVEEAHQRNTRGKSGWDWLTGAVKGFVGDYLIKGQVQREEYIDYTQRSSDNAQIPKVKSLFEGWIYQAQESEVRIADQITNWLLEEIDYLKENVGKVQNDVVDRYQVRLDKANQEIVLDFEKKRIIWQPLKQKALVLAEEFSSLGKILKEEV
jgi:hypothetical protein